MKRREIEEISAQLRRELRRVEDVDADSQRMTEELHRDVERLRDAERPDFDSLWDRAKLLETRFAARHPTLERFARELADALAKMGV